MNGTVLTNDIPAAYTWLGLSLIVLGLAALGAALGAESSTRLLGALVIIAGLARVLHAWICRDWSGCLVSGAWGVKTAVIGLLALVFGWWGLLALWVLGEGVYGLMLPTVAPKLHRRGAVLASALAGIALFVLALIAGGAALAVAVQLVVGGAMFLAISGSPMFQESL